MPANRFFINSLQFALIIFYLVEHLELLERGELKSLYDNEQNTEEDDDDVDGNEDDDTDNDTNITEEDPVDDRLSEPEDQDADKPVNECQQYPVLNISESSDLPEFNIEVNILRLITSSYLNRRH